MGLLGLLGLLGSMGLMGLMGLMGGREVPGPPNAPSSEFKLQCPKKEKVISAGKSERDFGEAKLSSMGPVGGGRKSSSCRHGEMGQ